VKIHPDNDAIIQAFLYSESLNYSQALAIVEQFSARQQEQANTNSVKRFLERLKRTEPGEIFRFIDAKDQYDSLFPVTPSYHAEIIYLDFWASWCIPCRAKHPALKDASDKFHDKGFEVIGISLDENKRSWLDAINKDGLKWINVSDLKGFPGAMAKYYSLSYVPFNLVLDKTGKILYKNISFPALTNLLEKHPVNR
jgi:thiol-disulfide isomerase/thioredoxin